MLKYLIVFLLVVFIVPALVHLGVWSVKERPSSWSQANWSSAGILPPPHPADAEIMLLAARTGGLKGAFATHSWLVLKKPGESGWHRYDKVGWGKPIRHNAYDADGRWYSNTPVIYQRINGERAKHLIPKVENAIKTYRWRKRGDYKLWPGPNSNTFIASVINDVPELSWEMPATAVGRDFPLSGSWFSHLPDGGWRLSLGGYAGMAFKPSSSLDLNFLGLVAGINWQSGQLKIPAFGTIG